MISRQSIQRVLFAACSCAVLISCAQERSVPLADVPTAALAAAETAVTGFNITSAEMEVERGMTVYELDGTADGQAYEIEVTAEDRMLEIETDDRIPIRLFGGRAQEGEDHACGGRSRLDGGSYGHRAGPARQHGSSAA